MEKILTEKELREDYLPFWQTVLGLQDWRINVHVLRTRDMEKDHRGLANMRDDPVDMVVNIQIRDQVDFDPKQYHSIPERDMEDDLVHELVHIRLLRLQSERDEKAKETEDKEIAVTQTTRALLILKRHDYKELFDKSVKAAAAMESVMYPGKEVKDD